MSVIYKCRFCERVWGYGGVAWESSVLTIKCESCGMLADKVNKEEPSKAAQVMFDKLEAAVALRADTPLLVPANYPIVDEKGHIVGHVVSSEQKPGEVKVDVCLEKGVKINEVGISPAFPTSALQMGQTILNESEQINRKFSDIVAYPPKKYTYDGSPVRFVNPQPMTRMELRPEDYCRRHMIMAIPRRVILQVYDYMLSYLLHNHYGSRFDKGRWEIIQNDGHYFPPDARVVHEFEDACRNCQCFVMEHPSFRAIPEGEHLPRALVDFRFIPEADI